MNFSVGADISQAPASASSSHLDGSTSIFELPNKFGTAAAPPGADSGGPVASSAAIPPSVMNDVITGIQQSRNALLGLIPSRDISMQTDPLTHDESVKPNYIPPPPTPQMPNAQRVKFVDDDDSDRDEIKRNKPIIISSNRNKQQRGADGLLYSSIAALQDPHFLHSLAAAIVYFVFDTPLVCALFYKLFPSFVRGDGALSVTGVATKAAIFGVALYFVLQLLLL